MRAVVTTYCMIRNNTVWLNGEKILSASGDAATFFKEAYKHAKMSYPKFHKMDHLSKLGLLAGEFCLADQGFFGRNDRARMAMVFANRASSLDTDRQHQRSISDKDNYLPSPAVFVYTLPNIVTGELAIRHKITGENIFFVSDSFDAELQSDYIQGLLESGAAGSAAGGWIDYDGDDHEAFIYLVEMQDDSIKNTNFKPLNRITLNQLYQQQ